MSKRPTPMSFAEHRAFGEKLKRFRAEAFDLIKKASVHYPKSKTRKMYAIITAIDHARCEMDTRLMDEVARAGLTNDEDEKLRASFFYYGPL